MKEAISLLAFAASTLGIAGFAVKVDKFEYNHLISNKLNLSINSYKKLKLSKGNNFYYWEDEKSKLLKITDIKVISPRNSREVEYVQLSLEPRGLQKGDYPKSDNANTGKIIKYFLESKPFWTNLFN